MLLLQGRGAHPSPEADGGTDKRGGPSRVRIVRQQGRRALEVDGVVQSIEVVEGELTPGYWPEMLPTTIGARALLLGYGGGTLARLLLSLRSDVSILAIDEDPRVLATVQRSPRLRIEDERLVVELGDAFAASRRLAEAGDRFDFVAVDLYRGGEMVRATLARPFLRRLGTLLTTGGTAAFNLPRDRRTARRLRRLAQHLAIRQTRLIGLNCVVHCGGPEGAR